MQQKGYAGAALAEWPPHAQVIDPGGLATAMVEFERCTGWLAIRESQVPQTRIEREGMDQR